MPNPPRSSRDRSKGNGDTVVESLGGRARSLVWIGHRVPNPAVEGSNPSAPGWPRDRTCWECVGA